MAAPKAGGMLFRKVRKMFLRSLQKDFLKAETRWASAGSCDLYQELKTVRQTKQNRVRCRAQPALLSRCLREYAGQRRSILRAGFEANLPVHPPVSRRDSSQYIREINFAGYGEMLPLRTALYCHPGLSRYITNLLPDADGPSNSHLLTDE